MKNLLIILSFVAMICGACMTTKEPNEYKDVLVRYVRTVKGVRWNGNQQKEKNWYVYIDDNNEEHWLESKHDSLFLMPLRR